MNMKKMKSLFIRKFEKNKIVETTKEVAEGCEWVLQGLGKPTLKRDGTCALIENGEIFRRYDCKKGRTAPEGFIPCQNNPDPITGHWPGWLKVDKFADTKKGEEKFFIDAFIETFGSINTTPENGTYELCGPKFQNNPEQLTTNKFFKHGETILDLPTNPDGTRSFDLIKNFLETNQIEGIVFHLEDKDNLDNSETMCKIKRSDFGFHWNKKR